MSIDRYGVYLTSDGSGDATGTIHAPPGILREVLVVNVAATKPTDNWDLTLKNTIQGVTHNLLVDETVSQTGAIRYAPGALGTDGSDGTDLTLTELQVVSWSTISVIGANMGDTKNAWIYVMIEH